jgi:integrase
VLNLTPCLIYGAVVQTNTLRMDTETQTDMTAVTVNQILDRYLTDCLPKLAPRTQRDNVRHVAHLRKVYGQAVASELRPRDFGPFLQVPTGRVQRCKQLAVLSSAFTHAVSFWYWMDRNVLRDVVRPKFKARDRLIKDPEFATVKALAPYRIKLGMQLALLTGQRQGDILDFKWSDIEDLPEPIVDPRTGDVCTMELNVQQAKTGKRLGILIGREFEELLDQCHQLPNGGCDGGLYILPCKTGKRYSGEAFRAIWQRTMKKFVRGGGERFTFHDIRALCATKCPSLEYAQMLLGHIDPKMTLRVYRRGKSRVMPLSTQK